MDKPEKLLYNISELQEVFGIGKKLAYDLAKHHGFPCITINGRFFFPREAVKKWVVQNTGKNLEI